MKNCSYKKDFDHKIAFFSLFSIILLYFRFGYHDNNENFINPFLSLIVSAKFQNNSCTNNEDTTRYHLLYLGKCIDYVINSIVLLLLCLHLQNF